MCLVLRFFGFMCFGMCYVNIGGSMASCRVCVQLQHLGQFWPYTTSVNLPNWNTDIRRHLDHWHWTYIPQYVHKLSIWSSDWTEFQDIPYNGNLFDLLSGLGCMHGTPVRCPLVAAAAAGWPSPPRSQTPCITETAAEGTMTVTNSY